MPSNTRDTNRHLQRIPQRRRVGNRMLLACINCKERKLRCDDQVPACANCQRFGLVCLVEDPATKRHQPRNYLETLEERVAQLESILHQQNQENLPQEAPFHDAYGTLDNGFGPSIDLELSQTEHQSSTCAAHASENPDDVDDLAVKVGMLSVAAGAEPHYLGQSSALAFCRVINSTLLEAIPKVKDTVDFGNDDKNCMPTPCLLPDSESCVRLSDAYFKHIHTQYPFLHEPTFRLWEAKLIPSEMTDLSSLDPVSLFFLYMVYAIGALLLPRLGYAPERLCATAQLYVEKVLGPGNLESIQAYLCYAIYSIRSPAGTSVWKFSGLALRQCIELGYHRHQKVLGLSTDTLRLELRKRAFWCAWTIDCHAATILGRPLGLQNQEFDCEYPLDIDDMYITSYGILGTPRGPNDPPTRFTKGIDTFRIRRIWGRIHVSLYSDIERSSPSHPTYMARINELRKELDDWRASLSSTILHEEDVLSIFSGTNWFDMCYNYSILYLYRGQLTNSKEEPTETTFFESMRAAEDICRGLRNQLLGRQATYTWGALHTVVVAGLTYLHCLWASVAAREASRQDVVSITCTDCTIVLVLMAQWNDDAAPYRDIFQSLASRTMTMLVEKNSEKTTQSGPMTHQQSLDPSLSQWVTEISDGGMLNGFGELLNGLVNEMPARGHEDLL